MNDDKTGRIACRVTDVAQALGKTSAALQTMLQHGLRFDALVQQRHLVIMELARRWPTLPIVIDHGAKPNIAAGEKEPGVEVLRPGLTSAHRERRDEAHPGFECLRKRRLFRVHHGEIDVGFFPSCFTNLYVLYKGGQHLARRLFIVSPHHKGPL